MKGLFYVPKTYQKIKLLKPSDIMPNPYQTRRFFDKKELERLAMSIKEVGILSPLIVRRTNIGYELICGQRRLRAAQIAKIEQVPALIVRAGDAECARISMVENVQRKNLSLCEEAEGFFNLMSYHGIKKEKIAERVNVERAEINEKVRLLSLSEKVRYKIEENMYSLKTAKELLGLRDEKKQLEVIEKAQKEELSEKEISILIKELKLFNPKDRKELYKKENMPLYINTVKKTVDLLKRCGAQTELIQKEDGTHKELIITIEK